MLRAVTLKMLALMWERVEEAQQCHKAVPPSKTVHLKAPSFAYCNSCSEDDEVISSHPSTKPEAGGVRAGAETVPGRRQADLHAALPICPCTKQEPPGKRLRSRERADAELPLGGTGRSVAPPPKQPVGEGGGGHGGAHAQAAAAAAAGER